MLAENDAERTYVLRLIALWGCLALMAVVAVVINLRMQDNRETDRMQACVASGQSWYLTRSGAWVCTKEPTL